MSEYEIMSHVERAPQEVARHFYEKYGCDRANDLILSQIKKAKSVSDSVFWQEVMNLINSYDESMRKGKCLPTAKPTSQQHIHVCRAEPRD